MPRSPTSSARWQATGSIAIVRCGDCGWWTASTAVGWRSSCRCTTPWPTEPPACGSGKGVLGELSAAPASDASARGFVADLQEHSGLYETIWWFLVRAEKRRDRPMLNLIMSNVRGPDRLAWRGHPVVALQSIGPLTGRMGLNFTAWSYSGDFTIGLHACRDQIPTFLVWRSSWSTS